MRAGRCLTEFVVPIGLTRSDAKLLQLVNVGELVLHRLPLSHSAEMRQAAVLQGS